jgi:glutamate-5-semialdehyde dehydrogenase
MKTLNEHMIALGENARIASHSLSVLSNELKNKAILSIANQISINKNQILTANQKDYVKAEEKGLNKAALDRLLLDEERVQGIINALESIAELDDPIGEILEEWDRPNGLLIQKVSVPLGVIGIIYESRPNVTADAAALCLKSGNAVILRGGSESFYSNTAIHESIKLGLIKENLNPDMIQIVNTTNREAVDLMLTGLNGAIDILVPRGGRSLVSKIQSDARIPMIGHLEGICHIYVDKSSNIEMAVDIVINSKMRRTGICGAAETLLIDEKAIQSHLPSIIDALKRSDCEIRADDKIFNLYDGLFPANEEDWYTEYLDAIISIKSIKNVEEAVSHINNYGSGHTESIVSQDKEAVDYFFSNLNSAIILNNASTQFADGGEFGMGAEIGIATDKIHARGPVGARQLTSYKYLIQGNGQTRPS